MIYTKTGDGGTTSLVGGTRVLKCHPRVEAYGTVDELNSHVGLLAELVKPLNTPHYAHLKQVQRNLFIIQTLLATEEDSAYKPSPLPDDAVAGLEHLIDSVQAEVPPLRRFVIPGGTVASAQCHVARTVCRRAERSIVALNQQQPVDSAVACYVNRLSDYLFVLARHLVLQQGADESFFE